MQTLIKTFNWMEMVWETKFVNFMKFTNFNQF